MTDGFPFRSARRTTPPSRRSREQSAGIASPTLTIPCGRGHVAMGDAPLRGTPEFAHAASTKSRAAVAFVGPIHVALTPPILAHHGGRRPVAGDRRGAPNPC